MPECKSVRNKCSHLSFQRFPKDKSLCREWKIKLRIGKAIGKSASVCSPHSKPLLYVMLLAYVKKKIFTLHVEKQSNAVLTVARQACFTAARYSKFIFLDMCLHFM